MSALRDALALSKPSVRSQAFDDALLALVPAEHRHAARLELRKKAEFTACQHVVADAVEFCERRQNETNDDTDAIIDQASARFHVKFDSIHSGWIRKDWKAVNRLIRHRKKLLDESIQ